jgi:chromosome segregation ATPase
MSSKKSQKKTPKQQSSEGVNIQEKMRMFYKVAKENLIKLKDELSEEEMKLSTAKEETDKVALEYEELLAMRNKLDIELKGMNERIQRADKVTEELERHNKKLEREITAGSAEIDRMKHESAELVKKHDEDIERMNKAIEVQIERFDKKILEQQKENEELKLKIEEAETQIEYQKKKIAEEHSIENKKTDKLVKDSTNMMKFLADL